MRKKLTLSLLKFIHAAIKHRMNKTKKLTQNFEAGFYQSFHNLFAGKIAILFFVFLCFNSNAQINLLQDYQNNTSANIGTFQGVQFREAGFSGLYPIPNTNGKEFWAVSDRGVNIDAANANLVACRPTYDKIYSFPNYAPKIHRIRLQGDSIQILQTITMKRPNGTTATGLINPTGLGSTALEVASTDTVLDCANFNLKTVAKDTFGIDAEGIVVDAEGNFWLCEEGGPTIWKLNAAGIVVKRFTPYANLPGMQAVDVQIDTVFKYRKNNRGFEGIAITPNGKIYAMIQSPILYPTKSVGESTRIHRILEIDPTNNSTKMFAYLNDGIIGASGPDQIRLRDWKIGDMAAINNTTFLVLEAALRGVTDIKRVYKIDISAATNVTSGLYGGLTLEALVDSTGLANKSIVPVSKILFMDLLANGWSPTLEKPEGLAILNDSTIAIGNDNDYGQVSPAENGVPTATNIKSHVYVYGLQGTNKLSGYTAPLYAITNAFTGPSSTQSPYVLPVASGVTTTSLLTVTDQVGSYNMVGIPDGLGAYDNNNGTFTLLMNHEITATAGVVRAHGSKGSFVSKWVINKSDLSVASGSDLIQNIYTWNTSTNNFVLGTIAISRLCSGDLPKSSAFYNGATGLGSQERIYMNGEETGAEGRAFGHIASGPNSGTSYQLPWLGRFSWENAVASPYMSDKTIVAGLDDGTGGQVYFYIGTKTASGTEIDKAGLNNGKPFGVKIPGFPIERVNSTTINNPPPAGTHFDLVDMGYVQNSTGAALEAASLAAGVTSFSRPEDGLWDPSNPSDFYFLTTDQYDQVSDGVGTQVGRTRVWKLSFTDINNPEMGGTVEAVLDGTEGLNMLDNATIDNYGHLLLQEDVGNQQHNGKIWQYTVATDSLKLIAKHDVARFGDIGIPQTAPFSQDEESSGIIDLEEILGPGNFMIVDQAHYNTGIPAYAVEGGQLLALYNPDTYTSSAEIALTGNNILIEDGDTLPMFADNTFFGAINTGSMLTKNFKIINDGFVDLAVNGINFTGTNAADFTLLNAPAFPVNIATGSFITITVKLTPSVLGTTTAQLHIMNSDANESDYDVTLSGTGVCPVFASSISAGGPLTFCNGGSVNLTASNATSYLWSNGATTQSIVASTSGSYYVIVSNTLGCTSQSPSTIVTITNTITITPAVIAVSCNGGSNGVVALTVAGGTAPYTYLWSNSNTSATISSLTAGTYTVIVTDSLGCTSSLAVLVAQPAVLATNFDGTQPASCGTSIGLGVANPSGGTSPYSYLWSNGVTTKTNPALSPGTYTVTVTDSRGCTVSKDTTLADTKIYSATVNIVRPSCNGASDGSACVTGIVGGVGPFTYSWNTVPIQTTACATGLVKGSYFVKITSAEGCNYISYITVTQPYVLIAAVNVVGKRATTLAQGGTKAYSYLWSNGKTTKVAYNLPNGLYTVTVTDIKGCTTTATAVISVGVKESAFVQATENALNVFPNPTANEVSFSFASENDDTYNLTIIDVTGKEIYNENFATTQGMNEYRFDFAPYARGIYAIRISNKLNTMTSRVIVK